MLFRVKTCDPSLRRYFQIAKVIISPKTIPKVKIAFILFLLFSFFCESRNGVQHSFPAYGNPFKLR